MTELKKDRTLTLEAEQKLLEHKCPFWSFGNHCHIKILNKLGNTHCHPSPENIRQWCPLLTHGKIIVELVSKI